MPTSGSETAIRPQRGPRPSWLAVPHRHQRRPPVVTKPIGASRLSNILGSAALLDADLVVDDIRIVRPGATGEATLFSRRRYPVEDVRPLRLAEVAHHDLGLAQPVVRRSLLEEHAIRYRAHGRATEDFAFLVDCTSAARHPIALPDVGYIYMKQANSVSGASSGFWLDSLSVTAELLRDHRGLDDASQRGLERRMKQAANRYHYLSAREAVSRSEHTAAGKRLLSHPGATGLASGAAVRVLLSRLRRGAKR